MNMKEQIHALSEEMIANLGRLVAIDSQLGTPEEGKPFGAGPAKALEEGLKIAEELGFKTVESGSLLWLCRDGRRGRDSWYCRTFRYRAGRR